jgi:3-oxoacyl-[acyl-carrier protein] reductase
MTQHAGRVVLVTGAGSGIGRAIAAAYGADGAKVAAMDVNADGAAATVDTITKAGGEAMVVTGDVARIAEVEQAVATVERQLGPVDTLINNAGISPKTDGLPVPCLDMDPAEWQRVVDINLTGVFNGIRVVGPGMRERKFGRIVNQSSVSGKNYIWMTGAHYAATKAALIGLTRHLAGELGPYDITVNGMSPGRIATELASTVSGETNERIRSQTPMGRFGTPEEVADLCLFLTSDKARFITGQVVDVAGGWMMT